jgi:hypothetical protein
MTPKALRWWLEEWHKAAALACYYRCPLTVTQFCASRGLEELERNQLLAFFQACGVEV